MECLSKNFYDQKILDASFNELKIFIEWMNNKKIIPTVIGGWAVWTYEQEMFSHDIDVVMPNKSSINNLLIKDFFPQNNYIPVKSGGKPKYFVKEVQIEGKPMIFFDYMDGSKQRSDSGNLGINAHWGWTLKFYEKKYINNLQLHVPKRELLIITKIIAALSRIESSLNTRDFRINSKIWKDYHDVAILSLKKSLDKEFLKEYLEKANVTQHFSRFISRYQDPEYDITILKKFGADFSEIESALTT